MNKRITLTLVLIMNLAWVLAQTSGTFGALTWSYADKQLTISGQGEMINVLKTEDIHPPKTGISVHFSGSLV